MKKLLIPFLLFASTALAQPAPGSAVRITDGVDTVEVTPAKELKVSGSFAMPGGSATAGKQDIGNASLASILATVNSTLTELQQKTEPANTQIVGDGGGSLTVDVATLPLPAGAATAANQTTIIGHVDGVETLLGQINSGIPIFTPLGDSAMDDVNDAVRVNIVAGGGGGGSGTEYTEGDTDASITGMAAMMETAADTLEPIQGSVVGGLLVNLGANNDVTVTSGTVTANLGTIGAAATEATLSSIDGNIIAADTGNVTISTLPNEGQQTMANSISVAIASNQSAVPVSGPLTDVELRATPVDVNITGGASSGTEYTEGATDSTIIGTAAMWEDSADTLRAISMAKPLPVQPGTAITFPVSAASLPLPSGAATAANQTTIIGHVDGIESALSTLNGVDFATETTLSSVDLSLTSIAATDFATETTLASILTELGQKTEPANTQIVGDGGGSLTVDGPLTDAQLRATPVDVNITGGSSAGTEYTEGDTDASITGTAAMMEVGSNTLQPVQGTVADGLLVNLGANNDVTVTGSVDVTDAFALDTSVDGVEGILTTIDGDTGNLVTVFGTSSLVLGTQADDLVNTIDGFQVSNLNYVFDGTAWDRLRGTSADGVLVNLGSNNDVTVTGTVAVTQSGTWDEVGINDSGNSITVDGTVAVSNAFALDTSVDGIETLLGTSNTNTGAAATALQIIDDWDETDRAKVNPIVGQAGVAAGTGVDGATVQRVSLATNVPLPAGTNAIGKLAANSGVDIGDVDILSIAAGNNNIGDVDVASITTGTNAIGRVGHDTTGVSDGRKIITTAGTRVTLAASTACKWVIITAETDNTGLVVIGGTTVVAALATRQGTPLYAGDSVTILIDNLNDVNLDSMVNGDGVTFQYGS